MLNTTRKLIILLVFFVITSLAWVSSQGSCNGTVHVIQRGENLFRLSLNYGVDMNTVAQLNGISDATKIFAGQSICMPTNGSTNSQSVANTTSFQTTTTTTTSGSYFVPCENGVECVPDQTQVHFHDGLNRCVSAKVTSAGLGWVPTDPQWCDWTNIITHSWDGVGQTTTIVTTTTNGGSSGNSSNNSGVNNANNSGDNLCFDGNAWGGQCDSDFMWNAGYFYAQYLAGKIGLSGIPNDYRSLDSRLGINTDSGSNSNNNNDSSKSKKDSSDDSDDSTGDSGDSGSSGDSGDSSGGSGDSGSSGDSGDSSGGSGDSGSSGDSDDSSGGSGDSGSGGDSGDSSGGSGDSGSGGDSGDSSGGSGDSGTPTVTADTCRNDASVLPLGSAPSASNNASGLLTLVNWARNYCGGLSALSLNSQLNTASERHSQDMADRNYFDHTAIDPAPHGSSPGQRAQSAGYTSYSGENIAAGNSDIMATFTQWWNSSGHRGNILGNHTEMGYGYGYSAFAVYRHYNTQMFGRG